jgi:hypothetical protein
MIEINGGDRMVSLLLLLLLFTRQRRIACLGGGVVAKASTHHPLGDGDESSPCSVEVVIKEEGD